MTDMTHIKPGDSLILHRGGSYIPDKAVVVERVTGSQIILNGRNERFRRKDGRAVSKDSSWCRPWLSVATPERIQEVRDEERKRDIIFRLKQFDWTKMELERLIDVEAMTA